MTDLISSAANPLVKRIRRLAERRVRQREGAFWVEGGQPVWRAVESDWPIDTLVVAPDLIKRDAERGMIRDVEAAGVNVARLSADLFTRLSERDAPGGIGAIVRGRVRGVETLSVPDYATIIALENVANPGNLGTIIRTADAAGAAGVVLVGPGADPLDPHAVKASMGSVFAVPVVRASDLAGFATWVRDAGAHVAALSGSGTVSHWDAHLLRPAVLLFGAEGPGLTEVALDLADQVIRIPMTGTAESLNLSTAVALMVYEAQRKALEG